MMDVNTMKMRSNQRWWNKDDSTHNGWHVVALIGGGHQRPEVRLTAHAHWRTLILHVLGDASRRQQPRGGAVVAVAAVSW